MYCERGVSSPTQSETCPGGDWGGVGDVGLPVKHGGMMGRGLKLSQFGACCGEILTPNTIESSTRRTTTNSYYGSGYWYQYQREPSIPISRTRRKCRKYFAPRVTSCVSCMPHFPAIAVTCTGIVVTPGHAHPVGPTPSSASTAYHVVCLPRRPRFRRQHGEFQAIHRRRSQRANTYYT